MLRGAIRRAKEQCKPAVLELSFLEETFGKQSVEVLSVEIHLYEANMLSASHILEENAELLIIAVRCANSPLEENKLAEKVKLARNSRTRQVCRLVQGNISLV